MGVVNFPTPLVLALFLAAASLLCSFLKCFFRSFYNTPPYNNRKIIGIKVYYVIKIFLHNKIHFKINSVIYKGIHV